MEELRARGLVAEDVGLDALPVVERERPWFVSLLLGTAGWVSGIFVLVIAFMLVKPSGAGVLLVGPLLLAGAWGLFRLDRDGAFAAQLALALSIAGQFATVFGVGEMISKGGSGAVAGVAFAALVLQAVLVVVMPNRLHRTMSALFACIAWAIFVRYALWDDAPFSSSHRSRVQMSTALAIAGWAIVWLPVAGLLYVAIRREAEWMARGWAQIVRPATVGLIVGLAITTLFSQPFESMPFVGSGDPHDGRVIWPLLSAAAALGALAAAFALGHRGLAAICIAAALLHLSHFYYAMGVSLLMKSLTMIAAGVILLSTAHSLRRHPGEGRDPIS